MFAKIDIKDVIQTIEKLQSPGGKKAAKNIKKTKRGKSRELTPGEIELVRSVFGDTIDTGKTRIMNKKYFIFQKNHIVMAPNGKIYYPKKLFSEDFSQESWSAKALFIHEMVHVWQHQMGVNVKIEGIRAAGKYKYNITENSQFSDFNIEQQGDIVRDYFYLVNGLWYPGRKRPNIQIYIDLIPFID